MLDPDSLRREARALEKAEHWIQAAHLWRTLAADISMTEVVVAAAIRAADAGWLVEAEQILHEVLAIHPRVSQPYFALGVLLEEQGNLTDAQRLLEQGLAIEERQDVLTILGSIQRRLNELDGAQHTFERSLELNPKDDEAHLGLAEMLTRSEPKRAVTHFRKALAAQPNTGAIHRGLGEALWRAGHKIEAEASIRRAIELDSADAWAHDFLGTFLANVASGTMRWKPLRPQRALIPPLGCFGTILPTPIRFWAITPKLNSAICDHCRSAWTILMRT